MKILKLNFKSISAVVCTLVSLGCSKSYKGSSMQNSNNQGLLYATEKNNGGLNFENNNENPNNKVFYARVNDFFKFCESLQENLGLSVVKVENSLEKIEEFKVYFNSLKGKKSFSHLYGDPIYGKEDKKNMSEEYSLQNLLQEAPLNSSVEEYIDLKSNSLGSLIFIYAAMKDNYTKCWNTTGSSLDLYNSIIDDFVKKYSLRREKDKIIIEPVFSRVKNIIEKINFSIEEKGHTIKQSLSKILEIIENKINKQESILFNTIFESIINRGEALCDNFESILNCDYLSSLDFKLTDREKMIDYILTNELSQVYVFIGLVNNYLKEKIEQSKISYLEVYKIVGLLKQGYIEVHEIKELLADLYSLESTDKLQSIILPTFTYAIKKTLQRNNTTLKKKNNFQDLSKMARILFCTGKEREFTIEAVWWVYRLFNNFEKGSKNLKVFKSRDSRKKVLKHKIRKNFFSQHKFVKRILMIFLRI